MLVKKTFELEELKAVRHHKYRLVDANRLKKTYIKKNYMS